MPAVIERCLFAIASSLVCGGDNVPATNTVACRVASAPALGAPNPAKKTSLAWRTDLMAARKEALARKAPLLLVIAFPSCKWWLRMERTTFADERIRTKIAAMVPVLLQGEDDGNLFAHFMVSECPCILLLDSAGKELARAEGLQTAEAFLTWLRRGEK